ncbi:MAG: class I SAM-dependent methyltransferase [Novipirellula sp. JB048]
MNTSPSCRMLNLGCGSRVVDGWVNIDFASLGPNVQSHNLVNGIPFPNSSFDVVYHSHVLEHLSIDQGKRFIAECYRVLVPGGLIRVVVPDLEQITRTYLQELDRALDHQPLGADNHHWMTLELLDQCSRHQSGGEMLRYLQRDSINNWDFVKSRVGHEAVLIRQSLEKKKATPEPTVTPSTLKQRMTSLLKRMLPKQRNQRCEHEQIGRFRTSGEVHRWMYDRFSLTQLLKQTGFTNATITNAFTSAIPDWESYQYLDIENGETRKPDSLFMEARKTQSSDATQREPIRTGK